MKLYGSVASPYVRRIRLLLDQNNYEFIKIDVFSEEGQKQLSQLSPVRRVPVLVDGESIVFDSYLITKYLKQHISTEDEKVLWLINEANDSGITLLQLERFGLDPKRENNLSQNHEKRILDILELLNQQHWQWDLKGQWLFCLLDWFKFRNIIEWDKFENLKVFFNNQKEREIVKSTDPRKLS